MHDKMVQFNKIREFEVNLHLIGILADAGHSFENVTGIMSSSSNKLRPTELHTPGHLQRT
jgi:hypothetical protein